MRFTFRIPSIKKRISSRLSVKRFVRSKIRMPRGFGIITNPKRVIYNKIYNRTSLSIFGLLKKLFR